MEDHRNRIGTLTALNEELENYFANTIIPQLFVDAELKLRKFTPPAMKQFKLKNEYVKAINQKSTSWTLPCKYHFS